MAAGFTVAAPAGGADVVAHILSATASGLDPIHGQGAVDQELTAAVAAARSLALI